MQSNNYVKLLGIEFIEFANHDVKFIESILLSFGFSKLRKFRDKNITYFKQNDINLLLNNEKIGFAAEFSKNHGPAVVSMGWRVEDANAAVEEAARRGAKIANNKDLPYPAIYGIGDSLIYFISEGEAIYQEDFIALDAPKIVPELGLMKIDHLTNNVIKGTMEQWASFYKDIFGFDEIHYFDIRGVKTGLTSYALRSPCGSFCIPINEGDEVESQIEEYLREYNGPGIQHIAFITNDILSSLDYLDTKMIETLDMYNSYYENIFERVKNVKGNKDKIRQHNVLVDGNKDGYLLQIFTKNLFGPIFIELIQRENYTGFGEGNFQALFEGIERNQ